MPTDDRRRSDIDRRPMLEPRGDRVGVPAGSGTAGEWVAVMRGEFDSTSRVKIGRAVEEDGA